MSREGRTLVILAVLGVGAVAVLGSMAKRYETMIGERRGSAPAPTGERAATPADPEIAVERFVEIREEMHVALRSREPTETVEALLGRSRDAALDARGGDRLDYEIVREAYRRWRIDAPVGPPLARAFDARADRLGAVDLGGYESLDR